MSMTLAQFWAQYKPEQLGVAKVVGSYAVGLSVLPVKQTLDLVFSFGKETSLGDVSARVINQPFDDTRPSTISPQTEAMVILGKKVLTDHLLADGHADARPNEQSRATRAVATRADDLLFNGDGSAAYHQFNGYRARCVDAQLIAAGVNGAQLTLAMFEDTVDQVVDQGNGRHAFMSRAAYRALKRLILSKAGGSAVMDVVGEVQKYEDITLHVTGKKLDGTPLLNFNETQGSSAVASSLYVMAPGGDDVELSGIKLLQATNGISVIEEGIKDSMYTDAITFAFGIGVFDDSAIARLCGILK